MVTLPFREASESLVPLGTLSQESPVSSGATEPTNGCDGSLAWRKLQGSPSSPSATGSINRSAGAFRARVIVMRAKLGPVSQPSNIGGSAGQTCSSLQVLQHDAQSRE